MNSNETTGWMPEPFERGTISLVQSSLLTLWLCVYSALHLNLPLSSDGNFIQNSRKTWWILVGIFALEIVVYIALMQRISAKKLTKIVTCHLENQGQPERKNKWTLKHSFFAQMGGFVIDTKDENEHAYILSSPKLSVTANGLALIAEAGHLPDISIKSIEDKSTQNLLAKCLALLQGTWFLFQILGRLVDRLPITLLEIHTAAHTLCALLTYLLWWEKPYDVSDAIILRGDWIRPFTAAMWMLSYDNTDKEIAGTSSRLRPPEIEGLIRYERVEKGKEVVHEVVPTKSISDEINSIELGEVFSNPQLSQERIVGLQTPRTPIENIIRTNQRTYLERSFKFLTLEDHTVEEVIGVRPPISIPPGSVLLPSGFGPNIQSKTHEVVSVRGYGYEKYTHKRRRFRPAAIPVNEVLLARWQLACEAFQSQPEIWAPFTRPNKEGPGWTIHEYPTDLCQRSYLNPRIPDFPWKDLIDAEDTLFSFSLLAICATVYGGIHASAWMDYFPSPLEQFLWRASLIVVSCTGLGWAFYKFIVYISHKLQARRNTSSTEDDTHSTRGSTHPIVIGLICLAWIPSFISMVSAVALIPTIYICARVYLPFEALISLRDLPIGMYQTTRWNQVLQGIPHL